MFKKFLLSLVLILAVIGGFFVVNNSNRALAISANWVCAWEEASAIQCRRPSGSAQWWSGVKQGFTDFITAGILGDLPSELIADMDRAYMGLSCDNDEDCGLYTYWPGLSADKGWPIYCTAENPAAGKGNNIFENPYFNEMGGGCLHFNNLTATLSVHPDNSADTTVVQDCSKNGWSGCLSPYGKNLTPTDLKSGKFVPPLNWNGDSDSPNYWVVGRAVNATKNTDKYCSWAQSKDCIKKMPKNSWPAPPAGEVRYTGPGLLPDTVKTFRASVLAAQAQEYCENTAPLGFITCPIYETVTEGIGKLIGGSGTSGARQGLLIDFLTFKAPAGGGLAETVGGIVAVANLFYVVIFLILIFSSSMPAFGMDNYTIKKTLPKFILAVIMTQFAYVICFVIVDFFNLLGNAIPNLIFAIQIGADPPESIGAGLSGVMMVGGSVLIGAVGWILIFILAIIALIACIVAFVYMVLRYLILFILILLSPIAFASWVLPGTKKFFDQWWINFIRLNAMFLMITGMLALSIMLSRALTGGNMTTGRGGGGINDSLQLVGMVLPIIALLLIPKTLKWTTKGMNALAAGMMGAVSGKMGAGARGVGKVGKSGVKKGYGKGKESVNELRAKKSAELFGRGNQRMAAILGGRLPTKKGILTTSQQTQTRNTEADKLNSSALNNQGARLNGLNQGTVRDQLAARGMKGLALRNESARIEKAFTDSSAASIASGGRAVTNGYELYDHQLGQVARGSGSDLLGVKSSNGVMQTAAIGEMGSRGNWQGLRDVKNSKNSAGTPLVDATTVSAGLAPHMADVMGKAPDVIKGSSAAFGGISAEKAVGLDASTMGALVAHVASPAGSIADPITGKTAKENLHEIGNKIHGDKNLNARLDSASRVHLNSAHIPDGGGGFLTF